MLHAIPLTSTPAEKEMTAYVCFVGAAGLALCYLLSFDSIRVVSRLLGVAASAFRSLPGLLPMVRE